jgi:hypothetical protein
MPAMARPFEVGDIPAVLRLLQQYFSIDEPTIRHRFFENPCHPRESRFLRGCLLWHDGGVVGFHGAHMRQAFFGQRSLALCVHCLTYVAPAFRDHVAEIMLPILTQADVDIHVANTANPQAQRLFRGLRWAQGVASCARIQFRVTSAHRFGRLLLARNLLGRKLPAIVGTTAGLAGIGVLACRQRIRSACTPTQPLRLERFPKPATDEFWSRLLAGNRGLLTSRTSEELDWLFGQGLKSGCDVLLARVEDARLAGYAVLRKAVIGGEMVGRVMDWVAEDRDPCLLGDLLLDVCTYARDFRMAAIEISGFPTDVQSMVRESLPFTRKIPGNPFVIFAREQELLKRIVEDPYGWFWGPVDGDKAN